MKTIGMIGGMSWESSAEYYRIINEEIKTDKGGLHSAKCILFSVDFDEVERFQSEGKWTEAAKLLGEAAKSLEAAGADLVILCTNTMHKVADEICEYIKIPFLHIADAAAMELRAGGIGTVGLLGTKYTMEQEFYKERLQTSGIKVIIPEEEDRKIINEVIFNELCLGKIEESSHEEFKRIIKSLQEKGAEGIVLGCTEIGLLIKEGDTGVPLFDTAVIHAKAAVKDAL